MKRFFTTGLFLVGLFNFSGTVRAQSMYDLFLQLPAYCTPGLNNSGRKSLIKDTEYTVTASKEEDEIDYTIDTVTKNYIAYEFSNSKGRGTNENYELKRFKFSNGKSFVLFSKTGDPRVHSNKYILRAYDISGNSLIENFQSFIPEDLDYAVFLKFGTPDSIRTYLEKTSYYTFDLDARSDDKVIYRIIVKSEKDEKWLNGNTMVFNWTGTMFTNTLLFRKDDQ